LPFVISASTGNCSPGFTSSFIPACNCSTGTDSSLPATSRRVATFGAVLKSERISRCVRPIA
jgi:hypothetical protein